MAQESDVEVKDLQISVTDVTYELSDFNTGDTYLTFLVSLEVWNPYDGEVTDYGSSSCPIYVEADVEFNHTNYEKIGTACTSDYGPNVFDPGLMNFSTFYDVVFLDEAIVEIPNGQVEINTGTGTYADGDKLHGAILTFESGELTVEYEDTPPEWGETLFPLRNFELDFNFASLTLSLILIPILTKRRN